MQTRSLALRVTGMAAKSPSKIGRVFLGVARPLLGQIVGSKNSRDWAHWNARAAIDAFNRIDVELLLIGVGSLVLLGMDAVNRACIHAGGVFRSDTGFRNYICHESFLRLWVIEF